MIFIVIINAYDLNLCKAERRPALQLVQRAGAAKKYIGSVCIWRENNLVLSGIVREIAVFLPNSRSLRIGAISPNSASLTVTKTLSLHLLSAIDLERPSLCGGFSLSPVLNVCPCCLSFFLCLYRSIVLCTASCPLHAY